MSVRPVYVTPELLQLLVTEGARIPGAHYDAIECIAGLPRDARLVGVQAEFVREGESEALERIEFYFSHPDFEESDEPINVAYQLVYGESG